MYSLKLKKKHKYNLKIKTYQYYLDFKKKIYIY